jgi:hypothetical protein
MYECWLSLPKSYRNESLDESNWHTCLDMHIDRVGRRGALRHIVNMGTEHGLINHIDTKAKVFSSRKFDL